MSKVKPSEAEKAKAIAMSQRLAEETMQREIETKRRKTVLEAVTDLTDRVDEHQLISLLNVLDTGSWAEVIEERFLASLCGWPLCGNPVERQHRTARFKLDRVNRKIFEGYADYEKFCSPGCEKSSAFVASQLHELPLWLSGERSGKKYELIPPPDWKHAGQTVSKQDADASAGADDKADGIEFIPDKIIAQLNDLRIAENGVSSDEEEGEGENGKNKGAADGEEADDPEKKKSALEDRIFLSSVRSYVTAKMPSTSVDVTMMDGTLAQKTSVPAKGNSGSSKLGKKKTAVIKPIQMTSEEEEAKLAKLRAKYGKSALAAQQTKQKPAIIEPKPLIVGRRPVPVKLVDFDEPWKAEAVPAASRILDWVTDATLKLMAKVRESVEMNTEMPQSEIQLIEQFFGAELDPREYERKKKAAAAVKAVALPIVDGSDSVHFKRVDILSTCLRKAWSEFVARYGVTFPIDGAKEMLATFHLTPQNCVVDPKDASVIVPGVFHLLTYCNKDLRLLLTSRKD